MGEYELKNLFQLKFCIWGTGRYGNIFLKQFGEYSLICKRVFNQDIMHNIEYFIDSDIEKQKLNFFNKSVISPDMFFENKEKFCVIAVSNRKKIFDSLDKRGFKKGTDYNSYEIFLREYKNEILRQRNVIFEKYNLISLLEVENHFCDLLEAVKESFQKLLKSEKESDYILKYIVFSLVIDKWRISIEKMKDFAKIREYFDDNFIVAAYAWYFDFDITGISQCFSNSTVTGLSCNTTKQTIGIVVRDYFGAGIEKTVSLLIPIYTQNHHKVVLITDSYVPDKEYNLPTGAIRHTMSNKVGDRKEKRLEELKKCIIDNKIDIMCFHSGYVEIATFYEMWFLKLLHIPVLMEVHSAFFPVIMTKKEVSRYYPDMYKMADRLIVLSNTDRVFWESLGCRCKYIQNPIEENYWQTEYINNNRATKTIVWIGRLVQNPKRVLDIVPIMERVTEKIPEARLKVVGLATEPLIYHTLLKLIEEKHLEDNIELCGYNQDISAAYKDADVVLMTSESESFCNVIMESKLSGKPIVMYEIPWLELLKDGRGYIAVKQKDTEAAAKGIIDILSDDEMRKSLSMDSYKSGESFRNHDVYADWKQVFDDILNEKSNEIVGCAEFTIIEKMLLNAIYDK